MIGANGGMMPNIELRNALVDAWRTNSRVTAFLLETSPKSCGPRKCQALHVARFE